MEDSNTPPIPANSQNRKITILIVAVVALIAASVFSFVRIGDLKDEIAAARGEAEMRFATLQKAASAESFAAAERLETLREELEAARRQATVAVGQAKTEAQKHATRLAQQLAEEQRKQQEMLTSEISLVKDASSTTSEKLDNVTSEVSAVKTEVASTKSELDRTVADLKRVTGDMGVMSGLIATNGKELEALRALGERNYYEFDLTKKSPAIRFANVNLKLKKADAKRNRFTLEILADDRKVEKKDKTLNEPVQFYTSGARQPYELVVNQIHKDRVVGYLATPKVQTASN